MLALRPEPEETQSLGPCDFAIVGELIDSRKGFVFRSLWNGFPTPQEHFVASITYKEVRESVAVAAAGWSSFS